METETEKAPHCACGAQCLNILVNALKSHCCCAGSCQAVETRDKTEIWDNKEIRENEGTQENKETRAVKHSLEGVWEHVKKDGTEVVLVHTVRGKLGYLFGTKLVGGGHVPARQVMFWITIGDGVVKDILEGKQQIAETGYKNPSWVEVKLYWYSNNAFEIVQKDTKSGAYFTRLHMAAALKMSID